MSIAKRLLLLILISASFSALCQDQRAVNFPKVLSYPKHLPAKEKVWVFILAGQSNMAGRGIVEPQDTVPHERILTINSKNEIILAKEPLHFYEPMRTGLDCGLAFGRQLLKHLPDDISILLIPTAVGGSSSRQWLGDSLYRDVKLLTNFRERVEFARQHGTVKAFLWHQGESDTNSPLIQGYGLRLEMLFNMMRSIAGNDALPIMIGELGSYSDNAANWSKINKEIHLYADSDAQVYVIDTSDLKAMDDKIHFDAAGQRMMGERMATEFIRQLSR